MIYNIFYDNDNIYFQSYKSIIVKNVMQNLKNRQKLNLKTQNFINIYVRADFYYKQFIGVNYFGLKILFNGIKKEQ